MTVSRGVFLDAETDLFIPSKTDTETAPERPENRIDGPAPPRILKGRDGRRWVAFSDSGRVVEIERK